MKVALVTDGIWPYAVGGMQRHSYGLCKHLAQLGVSVDLYYTVKNKDVSPDLSSVFTATESENIKPYFVSYPTGLYFPGHYMWKSYQYSKLIYEQLNIRLDQYDIVYIQGFSGWYLLKSKMRSGRTSPPCIVNLHGLEMFQQSSSFKSRLEQYLFKPFARAQLRMADYVQSLGGVLTDILLSIGIRRSRILECPNAVEKKWLSEQNNFPHSPRSFAFIGRYETRKGLDQLNIVLRKLIAENADFEMHLIGPIPAAHHVKDDRIFYYGQLINENEIKNILDKVDFLVVPSSAEGMPTVVLEAMARCCAIIANNVGAISEMVCDENGILMGNRNVQVLYDSMMLGLNMAETDLGKMKSASRRKVEERFLWEKVVTDMKLIFTRLNPNSTLAVCSTE